MKTIFQMGFQRNDLWSPAFARQVPLVRLGQWDTSVDEAPPPEETTTEATPSEITGEPTVMPPEAVISPEYTPPAPPETVAPPEEITGEPTTMPPEAQISPEGGAAPTPAPKPPTKPGKEKTPAEIARDLAQAAAALIPHGKTTPGAPAVPGRVPGAPAPASPTPYILAGLGVLAVVGIIAIAA